MIYPQKDASGELIMYLDFLSDEKRLHDSWFVTGGTTPEEDYNSLYDSSIDWDLIAPISKGSDEYKSLHKLMDYLSSEAFKINSEDTFVDLELVKKDMSWKEVPKLAMRLRDVVKSEISARLNRSRD